MTKAVNQTERSPNGEFEPLSIGGSSAGSCVGVGYESGYALWQRLRGDTSQVERWARETRRLLAAGKALEPVVATAVREDYGVELQMHPETVRHPQHARIVGHLDAWIDPGRIGAEIKMWSGYGTGWGEPESDEVPRNYAAQCVHYMMLTGATEWHVYRLQIPSLRVDRYVLRRDQSLCDALLARELHMLALVDGGTPPDPADEAEAREQFFSHVPGVSVEASPEVRSAIMRMALARRVQSVAAGVISQATCTILQAARAAEWITSNGEQMMRLAANRTFDADLFRRNYPNLVAECTGFVPSLAREKHLKAYESCIREVQEPGESPRVLRTTKTLNEAIDRMVNPQTIPVMLPEILSLKESTE